MKFMDTLLGRTKPVRPKLDELFSLPTASITLQTAAGIIPTGKAGVCFKPPGGQPFEHILSEVEQLLRTGDGPVQDGSSGQAEVGGRDGSSVPDNTYGAASSADLMVKQAGDSFGYKWVIVEGGGIDDIVTRVHMVHSSISENGWGEQLLCSLFSFVHSDKDLGDEADMSMDGASPVVSSSDSRHPLYLVYLAKRGSFYPFAPVGKEKRDTEMEMRIKALIDHDLPMEPDLDRWFPLWDMPLVSG
ncbi:MAG: PspA-associated protein PspAB [Acidimicrobiales bacterium]